MNTPIIDFLNKYKNSDFSRFHMPGAKGAGNLFKPEEIFDITEINGADSLYEDDGIILESENNTSRIFGTAKTLYSTEGSSLSIKTMLTLAVMRDEYDGQKLVVASRNSHKAFINSCILLDLDVEWLYPQQENHSICVSNYTKESVQSTLEQCSVKPCCVYITSPDYLGHLADIEGISDVCKRFNVPLIVDNAHGAYLNFLPKSQHPISLGADMCCDSAHKTLPALTPAGYLHISKNTDAFFSQNAKNAMSIYGSTSPSYLVMASLDSCNLYLYGNFRSELRSTVAKTDSIKKLLRENDYIIEDGEPLKIAINTLEYGYKGTDFAQILREYCIEVEYADYSHIVLMPSTRTSARDFNRLENALLRIQRREKIIDNLTLKFPAVQKAMSIRKAGLSISEDVELKTSVGRICSKAVVLCPPGIPIVMSGEKIDENCIKILEKYSIGRLNVIK